MLTIMTEFTTTLGGAGTRMMRSRNGHIFDRLSDRSLPVCFRERLTTGPKNGEAFFRYDLGHRQRRQQQNGRTLSR